MYTITLGCSPAAVGGGRYWYFEFCDENNEPFFGLSGFRTRQDAERRAWKNMELEMMNHWKHLPHPKDGTTHYERTAAEAAHRPAKIEFWLEIGMERIKPVDRPWCDKWFYDIINLDTWMVTAGGFDNAEEAMIEGWQQIEKILVSDEMLKINEEVL